MKQRSTRSLVSGLGAGALCVALAACGSSSHSTSSRAAAQAPAGQNTSTGTGTGASSGTTPSSGGLGQASAFYSKFTHDKAGTATGSPVVIGFMNDQGGVPSYPESTAAGQAAADFVNRNIGGIDGHPVQLKTCLVTSEAQGTQCAQEFLAAKVPVVVETNGNLGGASFHQTLNGRIPVSMGVPASAADATAKNSYAVSAGVYASDAGFLSYASQNVHAKTASLLFPGDDPTSQVAAKGIKGFLGKGGIKVTAAGFSTSSPDMLPAVLSAGSSRTDLTIALLIAPSSCIAGYKAMQQAHITKPIIALQTCITGQVKQSLGDFPTWTYLSDASNPATTGDPATDDYLQVMKAYAPSSLTGGSAQQAFMSVLFAARALNVAGGAKATPAAIAAKMRSFPGPMPMFAPHIKYDGVPGLPAIPSLAARFYKYEGNGKWNDVTGGKWVTPKQ